MLKRLKLSKEALLFDSPLYLLKAFLAVMIGYVVFSQHPIIGKDMISVLFGMMLSLEPVSISGLKSGIAQFQATILGGVVTAIIVAIFGVNMITVPLGVMLTLYISILLDWKNISPVAFFTSIYMTQYIQLTASGDPSMLLTLRLRLLALGSGVLVAVVMNYIFGLLFYKSMVHKRTKYLIERVSINVESYLSALKENDKEKLQSLRAGVTLLFGDIDLVYSHVGDLNTEKNASNHIKEYINIISELRLLNHYLLDMVIESIDNEEAFDTRDESNSVLESLGQSLSGLMTLESSVDIRKIEMEDIDKNILKIHRLITRINASVSVIQAERK